IRCRSSRGCQRQVACEVSSIHSACCCVQGCCHGQGRTVTGNIQCGQICVDLGNSGVTTDDVNVQCFDATVSIGDTTKGQRTNSTGVQQQANRCISSSNNRVLILN